MSKTKKLLCALAALLVLWSLWYCRPISLLDLDPDLEPDAIDILISRFDETDRAGEDRNLTFDLSTSTPEGQALLDQLETIRIRRSPLNPLRQLRDELFGSVGCGRSVENGDYNYVIHIFGKNGWVALQFFIDAWEYDTPQQPQYLPCSVPDGEAVGRALGDQLWQMSKDVKEAAS